jgi:hypothetical protein
MPSVKEDYIHKKHKTLFTKIEISGMEIGRDV